MIDSRGIKAIRNQVLKKYMIAVLVGLLLGEAYVAAEQRPESQARKTLPKQLAARQSQMAKSFPAADDCAKQTAGRSLGAAVALSMLVSGGNVNRYIELRPAHLGGSACTW